MKVSRWTTLWTTCGPTPPGLGKVVYTPVENASRGTDKGPLNWAFTIHSLCAQKSPDRVTRGFPTGRPMAFRSRKGDAPAVGYPEWDRSREGRDHQAPETGRWDLRQERWIPVQRAPEGDDFGIDPFPPPPAPTAPPPGQ